METAMRKLTADALHSLHLNLSQTAAGGQSDPKRCCICYDPIGELAEDDIRRFELDVKCDKCRDASGLKKAKDQNERLQKQKEEYASQIPSLFLKTERDLLPFPEKLDAAMKWTFGNRGLLLYGPTANGKTRIAWQVSKREIFAGRTFKCINAYELAKYPSLFMTGEADKFVESLVKPDLVMLDDVFKAKPTERIEELLFAVIDERTSWERPCIVTLNDTSESLLERLSPDRGPALLRRLREFCQTIQF